MACVYVRYLEVPEDGAAGSFNLTPVTGGSQDPIHPPHRNQDLYTIIRLLFVLFVTGSALLSTQTTPGKDETLRDPTLVYDLSSANCLVGKNGQRNMKASCSRLYGLSIVAPFLVAF